MHAHLLALALAALATLASQLPSSGPRPSRRAEEPRPQVELELVCALSAVGPGDELEIGLHYRVPPGWHIYWHNPGDSGAPTQARLQAPPGFSVRGPLFPAPQRFEQPGDIVTYGYAGDPVLFFRVQAPADLQPGRELRFSATSDWLVCKEACFLGDGRAELVLASAASKVWSPQAKSELLDTQRKRLPRPWEELQGAQARWRRLSVDTGEGAQVELELTVPGARALEFFPAIVEGMRLVSSAQGASDGGARLVLRLEHVAGEETPRPLARGVLGVERESGQVFHELDLAVPGLEER